MTSELRVTTLSNAAGDGPATLTQQTAAKYYIHFGMNDFVIDQSFNSSSVTDAGTGHADLYFTNNMSAIRYSFTGFSNCNGAITTFNGANCWGMGVDYDTGTLQSPTNGLGLHTWDGSSIDAAVNTAQTFGDLA